MAHIEHDFPIEQVNPLAQREANAKRPIYMLHKWWARRLGCVFRTIVLSALIPEEEWERLDEIARRQGATAWDWLYYRQCHKGFTDGDHTGHGCAVELIDRYLKDKTVLDPFMSGGTTIVEALRLGCRVIGVDVNPVAWFVVKKSIEPVDLEDLDAAFQRLEAEVAPGILKFYRTPCPHAPLFAAPGGWAADVIYGNLAVPAAFTATLTGAAVFVDSSQLLADTVTTVNGAYGLMFYSPSGAVAGDTFAVDIALSNLTLSGAGVVPWRRYLPLTWKE